MKNSLNIPSIMLLAGGSLIMYSLLSSRFNEDPSIELALNSYSFWIGVVVIYAGLFFLLYQIKKIWKNESY